MKLGELLTAIGAMLTGASVVVAVYLYVHSLWREHKALGRRASALKSLIARECELNLWSIKRFVETFKTIEAMDGTEGTVQTDWVNRGPVIRMIDDDSESNWPVPDVHIKLMSSVLLDLATDHQALYSLVQSTLDALAELANARRQLISAPEQTDIGERSFLDGLAGYGLKGCDDARTALDALYRDCTGKELTQHRLR